VKQLAVSKTQLSKLCGICTSSEHPTDTCLILQDESVTELPQAYAANLYNQGNNQNRYNNIPDLSTNKYHLNWRNHPNLRYGNQQQTAITYAQTAPSLEDHVRQMAASSIQYQQKTDASIQNLTTQMGQMANAIGQIQAQGSGNLPAQTVVNLNAPNSNVSAITLRSGKVAEHAPEKIKKISATSSTPEPEHVVEPSVTTKPETERVYVPPIPFP
jgi:hypothetical protein